MATYWPPDDIGRDTIPVEPAHAATEVGHTEDDEAPEMLGRLLIYAATLVAVIATLTILVKL
jgi:hypothetical protein